MDENQQIRAFDGPPEEGEERAPEADPAKVRAGVGILGLILLAVGLAFWVSWPVALASVGFLLWLDASVGNLLDRARED